MRSLVILLVVVSACGREQNTEPPTGHAVKPPYKAQLADDAGAVAPAPAGGVTQKLFADDVPAGTLPLSIAIETIGDVASPIIPRGTPLPTTHTEVFSTGADDQNRVEVHVVQGERPLASQNRSLGKFQLFGIPPAPRGVPQIEVTFAVDGQGVLTVSARDKATGQSKHIVIDGAAGGALTQADVDHALAEAQAAKADDDVRRAWSQARLDLEQMIYTSRTLLTSAGAKLTVKTRDRVTRELAAADSVLKLSTKPENPALLRGVTESLRKTMHGASEELYKNAAP
jgi:molecular chaperone DnaK